MPTAIESKTLALIRCVLADNPNNAVLHQINRIHKFYDEACNDEMADAIQELLNPTTDENFKLVQSSPPVSSPLDAGEVFDKNADCYTMLFSEGKEEMDVPAMSKDKFIELWNQRPDAGELEKIIGDAYMAGYVKCYEWNQYIHFEDTGYEKYKALPDKDQYINQAIQIVFNSGVK